MASASSANVTSRSARLSSPRRPALAWAWLPLLLAALVRVTWILAFPADPIGAIDPEGYHLLAVNLLDGKGFAIGWDPPFCPTAVRTPLYPLFLAGVYSVLGRDPVRAVYPQVLLEVVTAAWVMALARRVSAPWAGRTKARTLGLIAGGVYAFNGTTQRFTGTLFSETLLLPLLAAALYSTVRVLASPAWRRAALAGMAWGLVILTKPNAQYLALAAGLVVLLRMLFPRPLRQRPRRVAPLRGRVVVLLALAGAMALMLAPWIVRNRLVLGRWMISTAFEENLARVSAVATSAQVDGVAAEPWTATWESVYRAMVGCAAGTEATAVPCPPAAVASNCERLAGWQAAAVASARRVVAAHPWVTARVHLRGVVRSMLDPGHRLWYSIVTGREWLETGVVASIGRRMAWSLQRGAVGDALAAFWTQRISRIPLGAAALWWGLVVGRVAVWGLAVRGAWRLRDRPWVSLLLVGTVLYHLVLPGPIAHDRFYVPAIPVVCVLLAGGLLAPRAPAGRLVTGHPTD